MNAKQILKESALNFIKNATELDSVAYLVKSLSDAGVYDSVIEAAVTERVSVLAPTSDAKSIAYTMSSLKDENIIDYDIFGIGTAGEIGFGVSCLTALEIPAGFTIGSGYYIKGAPDYAVLYDASGSHMTALRKHYMKIVGNTFTFHDTQVTGSFLPRMFINAGTEITALLVDIHTCGIENGVWVSKPGLDPASTNAAHNPISQLTNTPANNYGGLYKAAKTRGAEYFLAPNWVYTHLSFMAKAHGEAATSTAACAYMDVNPKFPKGNLNNSLRDVNDSSVTFTSSGYSNCALTGSGKPYAKTTHNGQECGIADLNGNMWEVASGFIRTDALGFLTLKESVDITSITDDSTGATGAYNTALYDVIDISDVVNSNAGWTYFGNGSNQVFDASSDRTTDAYKRTQNGIPLALGVSSAGTTEFGNDGLYRYLRNEMAVLRGGYWSTSSHAGALAMTLGDARTYSLSNVGGRACRIVA